MNDQRDRPLGELFSDLGRQVSTLVRREMDLARVELGDRASRLGRDSAMAAAGGAILHGAVLVLLAAAVLGLMEAGVDGWLAALIVGVVVGVIGAVVLRSGVAAIQRDGAQPSRTVESMRDNIEWAKEQTK